VDLPVKISPEGDIAHHPKGLVVGNDFGGYTGERSLSIYVILRAFRQLGAMSDVGVNTKE
jgi:hypothetical protein